MNHRVSTPNGINLGTMHQGYITSVEVESEEIRQVGSVRRSDIQFGRKICITSDVNGTFIETEVPMSWEREPIVNAYKAILNFLDEKGVFDEQYEGEIDLHSPKGSSIDSYYYDTENDKGVKEISFSGEKMTEHDIRKATGSMIEEMKENDLL